MKKTISILVAVSMIVVAGTVAGCTAYIEKPINPETFIAEIQKYL